MNTHLPKRNEDVNEVDDSFEHTHLSTRNEDVNEVDDSFEHTFIKEKWRCKWSRLIHLNTHLSKRNEDVNEVDRYIWPHTYQREMKM